MLILTQGAMGVLGLVLGALTISGVIQLWHLYILAFLSGSFAAIDAPIRQTFVSELVRGEDLPNAVALNSMSFSIGRFIGPAIAGVTIAAIGTGWCFLMNGLSFFGVLVSLFFLRKTELIPSKRALKSRGAFVEGLRYIRRRPDLVGILVMLFFVGTFGMNFPIFLSSMGIKTFHANAASYGFLASAMAVGTIGGALLNARLAKIEFRHLIMSSGAFAFGCVCAALSPSYWPFAVSLFITGIAALSFMNATSSLMQISTAPEMRGRMMALRIAIALGTTPLGAPVTGWIADHVGPRWAMGAAALSGIIAASLGLILLLRNKSRKEENKSLATSD